MSADIELIKVTSFDEKFKNLLRDYYSYGFNNPNSANKVKRATQNIDRNRLSNIFQGDMIWENYGDKISLITSKYSQEMDVNPFHKVYRFCKYKSERFCIFFSYNGGFKRSIMCGRQCI